MLELPQPDRLDIIGDVHGNAGRLRRMLKKLGYHEEEGVFGHAEREAVFVGDLINRGPRVREVLKLVRAMHDSGRAYCILGNHELNLLAYFTRNAKGQWRKPHSTKSRAALAQTLDGSTKRPDPELREMMDWLQELPLWLDFGKIRIVHASWDHRAIERLSRRRGWAEELIPDANNGALSPEQVAVLKLLKGPAITLDGVLHRVRWWLDPRGRTLREVLLSAKLDAIEDLDRAVDPSDYEVFYPYPEDAPPVIFGHYGIPHHPLRYLPNAACVDYGVARGGKLCAYRWDGEQVFDPAKFVFL